MAKLYATANIRDTQLIDLLERYKKKGISHSKTIKKALKFYLKFEDIQEEVERILDDHARFDAFRNELELTTLPYEDLSRLYDLLYHKISILQSG